MLAFTGIFLLLGFAKKEIEKGAWAMVIMGLAVVIFSLGLLIMGIALEMFTWKKIAMAGVIFTVFALATYAFSKIGEDIFTGVGAIAAMGVALIIFSYGVMLLGLGLIPMTWDKIGMAGAIFGALLVAVAGIGAIMLTGFGAAGIFMAIAAIGAMGVALILLGTGIATLSKVPDWDKKRSENFKNLIDSIGEAFISLLWPPWKAPALIASIPLVILMSFSLIELSKALVAVSETKWDNLPIEKIKKVIVGLGEAFAAVGASNAGGFVGETLKALSFGLLGPDRVKDGINATLKTAEALKSISKGIKYFWDMTEDMGDEAFSTDTKGKPKEGSLMSKISLVVGVINSAFAEIGKQKSGHFSYIGLIFGNDFSQTDTEKGIDAVKNAGSTLKDIAKGLQAFINVDTLIGGSFDKLTNNIKLVMTAISESFANVGTMYGGDWFSDGPVKKGIDSVKGVGDVLSGVANGLKTFSSLKEVGFEDSDFDPKTEGGVVSNIIKVITAVANAFSQIGSKGSWGTDFWGNKKWYADESIKRGVESVQGLGSELSNIANAVQIFGKLQLPQNDSKGNPIPGSKIDIPIIQKNITDVLNATADIFVKIGQDEKRQEAVKKGVDSIKGLGAEVKNISDSLKPFMDLAAGIEIEGKKVPIDIDKVKENIIQLTTTILNVIAAIGSDDESFRKSILPGAPKEGYKQEDIEKSKQLIEMSANAIKPILETIKQVTDLANQTKQNKNIFGEHGPIQSLLRDLDAWQLSLDKKSNVKGFKTYDAFINYIERYAKVATPFTEFQKAFKEHVKDMQNMTKAINDIKLDNIKEVIIMQQELTKLMMMDKDKVLEILKAMKDYMDSIENVVKTFAENPPKVYPNAEDANKNDQKQQQQQSQAGRTGPDNNKGNKPDNSNNLAQALKAALESSTLSVDIKKVSTDLGFKNSRGN
jgi:hypothetical protein